LTTLGSEKNKRDRLFRKSRPFIRKLEQTDNGFLWAAYQRGSFDIKGGLSQEEFLLAISEKFGANDILWVVEDDNSSFRSGRGQVCLVGIKTDGWTFLPSAVFFKWATVKNVLRSCVAFFQFMHSRKDVGVCRIEVLDKEKEVPFRMRDYGVLYPRGRIPLGNPGGDLFVFSINGKKRG
jgi:hypothetical protein